MFLTGRFAAPRGAACDACTLADFPYVPGYGPENASIVIVGEAPGNDEVRYGKPFIGRSGQLLDRTLNEIGVSRTDCYVTNACLCRPTPHRAPKASEITACRPRLLEEIKRIKPEVILALGNSALRALLGSCKQDINVSRLRGTPIWSDELGVWIIPSYHPAAVLRQGGLYVDFVRDIQLINRLPRTRAKVGGPEDVRYELLDTCQEVYNTLNWLREDKSKAVSVDTEWSSRDELLCIGLSWKPYESVVITKNALKDSRTRDLLNEFFRDVILIGQNFKSDLQRLWKYGVTSARTGLDTMLMHYTLDERRGQHDLGSLVRKYLKWNNYKDEVARYKSHMENCPEELMYPYNARDAAAGYLLVPELERELTKDEWNVLNNLLLPASDVLAHMEMLGIMVDKPYLKWLEQKLRREIEYHRRAMFLATGTEFNPNSYVQLVNVIYKRLNLPVTTNGFVTDKKTLEILKQFHVFPEMLLDYRKCYKFLSTYVLALLEAADDNDRVHTTFNLHGTVTGRLSSSDPVNLQNIGRDKVARDMFMATPGYTLVEVDLSQAEIRGLAWYSQDRNLLLALSSGVDIHTANAAMMFGIKPEDVTKDLRQAAKHLTFGVIYQMSAPSLAEELHISVAEAEELIERFFNTFKQAREWINGIKEQVLRTGKVKTPFGRTRRFPLITNENRSEVLREAVNAPIQSLASDITLSGLIKAGKILWGNNNTRLLLTVHDSIMLETTENPLEVGRWLANLITENVLDNSVPFIADIKYGPKWGTMVEVK